MTSGYRLRGFNHTIDENSGVAFAPTTAVSDGMHSAAHCGPAKYRLLIVFVLGIAVAGLTTSNQAQNSAPAGQTGDKTIEAAEYLAQAEKERECDPEGSSNWADRAIRLVATIDPRTVPSQRILDNLRGDSKRQSDNAHTRVVQLADVAATARTFLKDARVESAARALEEADPKGCYAGFNAVKSKIQLAREQVQDEVRLGDAIVWTNRKGGLAHYRKAEKVDHEYPGLDSKINDAQSTKGRRH